jgi:hypothetical protein
MLAFLQGDEVDVTASYLTIPQADAKTIFSLSGGSTVKLHAPW